MSKVQYWAQYILVLFALTRPEVAVSQSFSDCLTLEILALKKGDSWAKKKGHHNYTCMRDSLLFRFDQGENVFKASGFLRESCFQIYNVDTLVTDRYRDVNRKVKKTVAAELVFELIQESQVDKCCEYQFDDDSIYLKPNCCSVTRHDYAIDRAWIEKHVNKRSIRKHAKKRDRSWGFRNEYSMKEDRQAFYKAYSRIDSVDAFLKGFSRPLTIYNSHSYYAIAICLSCEGDTLLDITKVINTNEEPSNWFDGQRNEEVHNPRVNLILDQILPKGFLFKEHIRRDFIKQAYLDWVLEEWR
jgi:hypothetical protein